MAKSDRTISIEREQDAYKVGEVVFALTKDAGFSKLDCAQITGAANEIAINAIKHAKKGKAMVRTLEHGLEIIVEDEGPGIKDVKLIMQEGYTTKKGSLGIGLKAAKRAMDEFQITSQFGKGTMVVMRKYLAIPVEEIEYGVISLPKSSKSGEIKNGDAYVIKEYNGDSVLLSMIDGEGHGLAAHEAGIVAKDIVEEYYRLPLDEQMIKIHEALLREKGRGAVVALCRLLPNSLEYLDIGDIKTKIIADDKIAVFNRPGELGNIRIRLPALRPLIFNCPRKVAIVIFSDGIKECFRAEDLPLEKNAQSIANFILKNFWRTTDDATVLVVRRKK